MSEGKALALGSYSEVKYHPLPVWIMRLSAFCHLICRWRLLKITVS